MIESIDVKLRIEDRDRLEQEIARHKEILGIKYKRGNVVLMLIIEILLVILIYFTEEYGFSAIFVFLTIVPIWVIIMTTFFFFQKRRPAKRISRLYNHYLRKGKYQAIRVKSESCEYYSDDLFDYFLFDVKPKKFVLLRQQDFEFDRGKFPNECFVLPPSELLDIIGNHIEVEGDKIIPSQSTNSKMPRLVSAMEILRRGEVLIQDRYW